MRPFAFVLPLLILSIAATCCGTSSTAARPDPAAAAAVPSAGESAPGTGISLSSGTGLEVVGARLASGGSLLGVGYRLKGGEALNFGETYVIDEKSGKKFVVARVAKIGHLAPHRIKDLPDNIPSLYTMFDTNYLVEPGAKVTVVINGIKVEHVEVHP